MCDTCQEQETIEHFLLYNRLTVTARRAYCEHNEIGNNTAEMYYTQHRTESPTLLNILTNSKTMDLI